jgi:hypothetical protein
MTSYAYNTKVPVSRSVQNIIRLLERFGATDYIQGHSDGRTQILFKYEKLAVRIRVPNTDGEGNPVSDHEEARLWRCAEMLVKAKLVAIEEGIEVFESAFLSDIMTETGETVAERMVPDIKAGKLPGLKIQKLLSG